MSDEFVQGLDDLKLDIFWIYLYFLGIARWGPNPQPTRFTLILGRPSLQCLSLQGLSLSELCSSSQPRRQLWPSQSADPCRQEAAPNTTLVCGFSHFMDLDPLMPEVAFIPIFCALSSFLSSCGGRAGLNRFVVPGSWALTVPLASFLFSASRRNFQTCVVFLHVQSAIYCPCCISLKNYSVVLWLKATFPDFRLFSFHIHGILWSIFRISTVDISAVGNSLDILKFFSLLE